MSRAQARPRDTLPLASDREPDAGGDASVQETQSYLLCRLSDLAALRDGIVPKEIRAQCVEQLRIVQEWIAACEQNGEQIEMHEADRAALGAVSLRTTR